MSLSPEQKNRAGDELADITIYTLRLFDILGVDPERAVADKMDRNARKYPADESC
jgi:NTP pyrophosphatase (non-canonical NTP hydrolase)